MPIKNNRDQGKHQLTVRIYFFDIPMGFYRARNVTHEGLLLQHGPIRFPLGTDVMVEFFDREGRSRFRLAAQVTRTDDSGMRLEFDFAATLKASVKHWVADWEGPRRQHEPG